ncbi:zinc knuckle CX2CX4HX4C containing protein, partial [Tanacetum coccineum]
PIRVLNNPNSTIYESSMERDDFECFIGMVSNQRSQTDGHKDVNDNHYANMDINVSHMQNVPDAFFRTGSSLGNRNVKRPDGTQSNSQSTVLEYPNAKPIVNELGNTFDFIPNSLQSVRGFKVQTYNIDDVAKLFCVPLNSLKDIDDFVQDLQLESASMPNATRVNQVESGVTCDATFGVPLSNVGDLYKLINDIEVGKHDELLSRMTNDDRMETMDALGTIRNSIQADNNNADVIPCKVLHVDNSINLNVDESTIPNDPIVQSVDINTKLTSYSGVAGASGKDQPKVNSNFRTLVADPIFHGVNISIPRKVVKKVSTRFEHTLYGYFIGKRMAFLVVEYYARNNWAKHGLKRIMMNSKGFIFFKFDSRAVLEAILEGGLWLIRKSLCILKKWSMDTRLLKEELTRILTSSMCNDSWGKSSFAQILIEVNSEVDLVNVVTIGIPSLSGDGFTKETIHVVSPPIVTTSNVVTPTVEKTNDGFQTVGKKKKRKGKSKFTYGETGNSSKKDNLSMSNSFSALNDDEEDVENVYDESANLIHNTQASGSLSFTATAG